MPFPDNNAHLYTFWISARRRSSISRTRLDFLLSADLVIQCQTSKALSHLLRYLGEPKPLAKFLEKRHAGCTEKLAKACEIIEQSLKRVEANHIGEVCAWWSVSIITVTSYQGGSCLDRAIFLLHAEPIETFTSLILVMDWESRGL